VSSTEPVLAVAPSQGTAVEVIAELAPRRTWRARLVIWTGPAILGVAALLAAFPSAVAPMSPTTPNPERVLLPPNGTNIFGTDVNGLDVFSRVIWGARIDLTIALVSAVLALVFGTAIGLWTGYYTARRRTGWLSDLIMRGFDVLQAFPIFVLALALVAILGRHIFNVVWVLVILEIPIFARLTRSAVIENRNETYIDVARCCGNSELGILRRHLLPNSLTPSLVNASVVGGMSLLLTAGLSFVGAGVPPPTAEWGYMVSQGADNLVTGQWWTAIFPGLAIGIVVLGFAMTADALRHYFEPKRRHAEE
jgi:peptide/nickel transport system permease protein